MKMLSGLVTAPDVEGMSEFDIMRSKLEVRNKLKMIEDLPPDIAEAILSLPQYEIIFEGHTPYYVTQEGDKKRELPKRGGLYCDPVELSSAFGLVIDDVRRLAREEYEETMLKRFGHTRVLGGVHIYLGIEARIMLEKYGITYINHPSTLNYGLKLD